MIEPATLEALRQRKRDISARIFEIEFELAKSKRAWACSRGGLSFEDRASLEEEHATLRLERHNVIQARDAMEAEQRAERRTTMEQALCDILMARGMRDVIVEARARVEVD